MHSPGAEATAIDELRSFPASKRRQILALLTAPERARVTALLREAEQPAQKAGTAEPEAPVLSPWLRTRLRETPESAGKGGWRMTPASHAALVRVAAEVAQSPQAAPAREAPSKSLLSVLGELMLGKRAA